MSKILIIAEKPSVAADIAKALGGLKKEGDYYEGDDYVVSSAVGHLVEIAAPEGFEVKRGKWSFEHLPVIPPSFDLVPVAKTRTRLTMLGKLIRRKDVGELINACDAGREGELIFRYIVQYTKTKKPFRRLWLQSMTQASIREAFRALRGQKEMDSLADAARCRSEADWLVGINGTRAMTAFNSRGGGFFLTTVGRVQTPTLAIVVAREEQIRGFKPRQYWEVCGQFSCAGVRYEGTWFDPKFHRTDDSELRADRIWSRQQAEQIAAAVQGQSASVTETRKRTTQAAPALFDLTSLQREANNRFGFPAQMTLSLAQALYEKHKALTYPRTDSRALPEDYIPTVLETLASVGSISEEYRGFVQTAQSRVRPDRRIFNNKAISDHFAIIPTGTVPRSLTEPEQKIYDMVARRFMAVFFPPAEYDQTVRVTVAAGQSFRTEGKVLVEPGWRAVYGRQAGEDAGLQRLPEGAAAQTESAQVRECSTKPPVRYTEATLLSAMEGAGKLIDEQELRNAMDGKGLGTPATRASIIEGLIDGKYMLRDQRDLVPTAKAIQLMTLLRGLKIDVLTQPELTGDWEYQLGQIEHGHMTRQEFMEGIRRMTETIVDAAKRYEADTVPVANPEHLAHACPSCGGEVVEAYRSYACAACGWSMPKIWAGRVISAAEADRMLGGESTGLLEGFTSRQGWPFRASLSLGAAPDFAIEPEFEKRASSSAEKPKLVSTEPLGLCPECKSGKVFEYTTCYACEKAKVDQEDRSAAKPACTFRFGHVILEQLIDRDQAAKICSGSSDELAGFVSNRTHRKFSARLVLKKTGGVAFKFAPREEADKPKARRRAKSAS